MVTGLKTQGLFAVGGAGSTEQYYPVDLDYAFDPGKNIEFRNQTWGVQSPNKPRTIGTLKPSLTFSGNLTSNMALLHLAYISQHVVSATRDGTADAASWVFKGGYRSGTDATLLTYFQDRLQVYLDSALSSTNAIGFQLNDCVPTSFTISGSDGLVRFTATWIGKSEEHVATVSLPTVIDLPNFDYEGDVSVSYNAEIYTCDSFEINFVANFEQRALTIDGTSVAYNAAVNNMTFVAGTTTAYGTITAAAGTPFDEIMFTPGNWITISGCTDEVANNKSFRILIRTDTVLTVESGRATAQVETSAAIAFVSARPPYGTIKQTGMYDVNGSFTLGFEDVTLRNKWLADSTTQTLTELSAPDRDVSTGAILTFTIGNRVLVSGATAGSNHQTTLTFSSAILMNVPDSVDGERILQTVNFRNEYNATDDGSWQAQITSGADDGTDTSIELVMNAAYVSA